MKRLAIPPTLAGLVLAATLVPFHAAAGRPILPTIDPATGPTSDSFHVESDTGTDDGPIPLFNTSLLVFRPTETGGFSVGQAFLTADNSSFAGEATFFSNLSLDVSLLRPGGVGNFAYALLGQYQVEIPGTAPASETGVVVGVSPSLSSGLLGQDWLSIFSTATVAPESTIFYSLTPSGVELDSLTIGFLTDLYALAPQYPGALGSAGGPTEIVLNLVQFSEGTGAGTLTLTAAAVPEAGTWAAGTALVGLAGFAWLRKSRNSAV
jgi:hypothetical protein